MQLEEALQPSEKVKNWLLMGWVHSVQQDLYHNHWLPMEAHLGAQEDTDPIDEFLRDLLRWRLGKNFGIERSYGLLREWLESAEGDELYDKDRSQLCCDLPRLSKLYGTVIGSSGPHPDEKIELERLHLRRMVFGIY